MAIQGYQFALFTISPLTLYFLLRDLDPSHTHVCCFRSSLDYPITLTSTQPMPALPLKPLPFPMDTFSDCPRRDSSTPSLNSHSISYLTSNFSIFKCVFPPPPPKWIVKESRNQGTLKLHLQPVDTKSKVGHGPNPAYSNWFRIHSFLERF